MTYPNFPFRVAFVGGGSMARAHARALRHIGMELEIVGVVDADDSVAAEFASLAGTTAFPSLDAMLADARPNVVHVCTTAGTHADVARQALLSGAHIYVEKPFVESVADAKMLLAVAASRRCLVCAGHQLLGDPVYETLMAQANALAPLVRAESELLFQSPTLRADSPDAARIAQLLDVLPHPLYSLVAAMERIQPNAQIKVVGVAATPTYVEALFEAGQASGRLYVSLVGRPVTSTLSVVGANGTLSADFIRGCVTGVANPGTSPIEKILNPIIAGTTAALRAFVGVARRILKHGEYPGLVPLIRRFYLAVARGEPSPVSPDHLLQVVGLYEELTTAIRAAHSTKSDTTPSVLTLDSPRRHRFPATPDSSDGRLVVVTGASGFLGRRLARHLAARGYRVRGVGRGRDPEERSIHEWVRTDLSRGITPETFAGAYAVVHAAAATSGGFVVHQRHSVDAARNVVDSMAAAGVTRLVHISSLSVVRPPRSLAEVQDENTTRADDPRELGPYTWGKSRSEQVIEDRCAAGEISLRVIRPAALTDHTAPEVPGLIGRRLFGPWHLCLGRPSLPFAACDVELAAAAIAWYVENFESAPRLVNLMDPDVTTRASLLRSMRDDGWNGRGVWVPIPMLAAAMSGARLAISAARRQRPEKMAVWQILRPRRFDTSISAQVIAATRKSETPQLHFSVGPIVSGPAGYAASGRTAS